MTLLATVFDLDSTLVDGAAMPGVAELVALAAELGPVGLVSASPRRYVRAAASASGIARHVQAIVAADDVTGNPHLLAARKLDLDPVHCLAVEGSATGIRSAHAAGMTVLAIPGAAVEPDVLELVALQASDARVAAKEICQLWVNVYALSR